MSKVSHEPLMEMFIFESVQLIEQLEQIIIISEKLNLYSSDNVNEIFRIMHTIKGSAAMMMYNNISTLAHSIEDLFYFIREESPKKVDFPKLTDLILKGADFIKTQLDEIDEGRESNADSSNLISEMTVFLEKLKKTNFSTKQPCKGNDKSVSFEMGNLPDISTKKTYKAVINFDDDCKMENVRAFAVVHSIKELVCDIYCFPPDLINNNGADEVIAKDGLTLVFKTDFPEDTIREVLMQTIFLKSLSLQETSENDEMVKNAKEGMLFDGANALNKATGGNEQNMEMQSRSINQSMISVSIAKMDKLMDLVGELVISESMVTQNPDLKGLSLDNFSKAARQHRKITMELQDTVMSIRMVPLSATFQKMNRIIRDMCKKLEKNVQLEIIGEETEVDKNIVEHISDPLMHIIRNSIDHGIESATERALKGKNEAGLITLEAKNAGGDVLVIIKDDGKGLDKEKILKTARENGLINRPENDLTEREIFSYIFLPGFSTNDNVSEFSGRGVGMDVVTKSIEKIGGAVNVDSVPEKGTTVTIKIPLTLAIINGMTVKVGKSTYTIPLVSIKESFRIKESDVTVDPQGNEMIMIRGECYSVLRLHKIYSVKTDIINISDGIIMMIESGDKSVCIFVDELIGEQQVVVKALPSYVKNFKKARGVEGCTLLGDGSISLILDISGLINY